MTKKTGAYLVIVAGIILLIINLSQLDFDHLSLTKGAVAGIISNLLLILAMIISIRDLNKKEN